MFNLWQVLIKIFEIVIIFFVVFDFDCGFMIWMFVDFWMLLVNFDIMIEVRSYIVDDFDLVF